MDAIYAQAEALHIPRFLLHPTSSPFLTVYAFGQGYNSDFQIFFYIHDMNDTKIRTMTRVKTKMSQLIYYERPQLWPSFTDAVRNTHILDCYYDYDIQQIADEYRRRKKKIHLMKNYLPLVVCEMICDYLCSTIWHYYQNQSVSAV